MSKTVSQLANILVDKFKITQSLSGDSDLNELGLDSLDVINFLFTVEQETGVSIPDEILAEGNMNSLADFAAYVDQHKP